MDSLVNIVELEVRDYDKVPFWGKVVARSDVRGLDREAIEKEKAYLDMLFGAGCMVVEVELLPSVLL